MSTPFRTLENRPGVVYDEDDTKRLYAEDMAAIHGAVNALEAKLCDVVELTNLAVATSYADFQTPDVTALFRVSYYAFVNPSDADAGIVRFRFLAHDGLNIIQPVTEELSLTGLNQIYGSIVVKRGQASVRYKLEVVSGIFDTARVSATLVLDRIN